MVEEDDDLAGAVRRRRDAVGILFEERPGEGQHQQRDRGAAQEQQQPVVNLPPLHRLVRNPAQEHQRREVNDLFPLPPDQMDQHGHGYRREPEEERRGQKGHGFTAPGFTVWRLPRY